jgi:predicted DNA-binding transcriptional regulator YafY
MIELLRIFEELTDEEHRLNAAELTALVNERGIGAERKSIYRDIEALINSGVDIIKTGTGYYLASRRFEDAEVKLLLDAVQAASFITERKTEQLSKKLFGLTSKYIAEGMLGGSKIGGLKCENEEIYYVIDAVNRAIGSSRQISFSYYKLDPDHNEVIQRQGERYAVNPYAMVWVQDRYYLVCNMTGRDDLTHFRLDRMRHVNVERAQARHFSEVSEFKRTFDVSRYAAKCLNMYGGIPEKLTLRCENSIAGEIFDRFGKDTDTQRDGEDHFIAHVQAAAGIGLISFLSQFGPKIEILMPGHIRETMKQRLSEALSLYE